MFDHSNKYMLPAHEIPAEAPEVTYIILLTYPFAVEVISMSSREGVLYIL